VQDILRAHAKTSLPSGSLIIGGGPQLDDSMPGGTEQDELLILPLSKNLVFR
jgi:hypothetical protein